MYYAMFRFYSSTCWKLFVYIPKFYSKINNTSLECLSSDFFTKNAPGYSKNNRIYGPVIPGRVRRPSMEFEIGAHPIVSDQL